LRLNDDFGLLHISAQKAIAYELRTAIQCAARFVGLSGSIHRQKVQKDSAEDKIPAT